LRGHFLDNYSGLKVIGFRADETACGLLRVQYPLDYLAKLGATTQVVTKVNLAELQWADFIIAQRQYNVNVLEMMSTLKDSNKIIIYEVDDALNAVHIDSPAYRVYHQGTEELKRACKAVELSHGLTVSTPELAAEFLSLNRNTYVVSNCIDFDIRNWTEPVRDRDPALTVVWLGGSCFDDKTELLTENGFKLFIDLVPGEKVATINKEGKLVYQEPTAYVKKPYSGKMHLVDKQQVNYCVTPDHHLYVAKQKRSGDKKSNLVYGIDRQSKDLFGTPFYCRKDATWQGTKNISAIEFSPYCDTDHDKQEGIIGGDTTFAKVTKAYWPVDKGIQRVPIDSWLKFFGLWLADGWTTASSSITDGKLNPLRQVGISQPKNPELLETVKALLTLPTDSNPLLANNSIHLHGNIHNSRELRICNKTLWTYLNNQMGGHAKAHEKSIPRWMLDELPPDKLRILLDWYIKGDGHIEKRQEQHIGRIRAWTTSKQLADNLCELALKIGWAASVKPVKEKRPGNVRGRLVTPKHQCYLVSFIRNDGHHTFLRPFVKSNDQQEVDYNGNVYCVMVPNQTLYVRRKGICHWSGNTHQSDLPLLGQIAKALLAKHKNIRFGVCSNPDMIHAAIESWDINPADSERLFVIKDAPIEDYPQLISYGDIGLAPITNTTFNRSKCLDKTTRILTKTDGILTLKELQVGSSIWTFRNGCGKWVKVLAKETQEPQTGIRITTECGAQLDMTTGHRTPVNGNGLKCASDLKPGDVVEFPTYLTQIDTDYVTLPYSLWWSRHSKHKPDSSIKCSSLPQIVIDETWGALLGYFVGDGSCSITQARFTIDNKDQDVIQNIVDCLRNLGLPASVNIKKTYTKESLGCSEICTASSKLLDFLATLGVATDRSTSKTVRKRTPVVPDVIWRSPSSVIAAFIRAYFECDATATTGGHLVATSKDEALLRGIQQLLLTFGIVANLKASKGYGTYADRTYWKLSLSRDGREMFNKYIGFVGDRKNNILKNTLTKKRSNRSLPETYKQKIVSIEPIQLDPIDIQVEGELFCANGIVTHNSALKLMEYGAWGVPYVASRVAPYQRYIDQGVDGWTADTISEWVEKVSILIENPQTRKEMGEAAQTKVREHHDYAKNIHKWVEAWEAIRYNVSIGNVCPGPEVDTTVGRNSPCPCGSGDKYKRCRNNCYSAWGT